MPNNDQRWKKNDGRDLPGLPHLLVTTALLGRFSVVSKAYILAKLPELSQVECQEIGLKLARVDADEPLTNSEMALLDARLAAYEKDPDAGSS